LKLSTCGQALGGSLLFRQRLGFSGTPSDMLPVELGKCRYEKGSDAKMMHLLTSPQVVSHQVLPGNWSVKGILELVAKGNYHALLDTGALITGMTNLEVSTSLLKLGLPQMEGVVFLDDDDRKMILLRQGMRVVELSQSGIPPHKRFSFYDQIHTTGMDIHQALNAKAVLTLGKDMVFRDYAQGAFRMRGIGKGQTIHLYIVPEVLSISEEMLSLAGDGCAAESEALRKRRLAVQPPASSTLAPALSSSTLTAPGGSNPNTGDDLDILTTPASAVDAPQPIQQQIGAVENDPALLRAVCAWLVINTMKAERLQFNLLCEQSVQNVWRKRAFWTLLRSFADGQTRVELMDAFAEMMNEDTMGDKPLPLDASVEVFRERVDYTLANAVPDRVPLHEKLGRMIRTHEQFLVGPNDAMRVSAIQRLVIDRVDSKLEEEEDSTPTASSSTTNALAHDLREEVEGAEFARENVQENEQEQEQEQHAEQEQEQEQEQQMEIENETFSALKYDKESHLQPWQFASLADAKSKLFYPASEFTCYGSSRVRPHTMNFPPYLLMSPNFYKQSWNSTNVHRRLKNVIVIMEWVPNLSKMQEIKDDVEEATLAAQAAAMAAAAASQAAGNKKGSAGSAAAAAKAALAAVSQTKSNLGVLTPDQERILQHAFDLHSTDALNHEQIREVLSTLGQDIETAEEMQEVLEASGKPGAFFADFDMLKRIVLTRPLEKFQAGRFYVMVSLLEAETLRGILHARADVFDHEIRHRDFVDNANTAIALRLADFNLREDKSVLVVGGTQQQPLQAPGGARLLSPLEQTGKFVQAKRFQDLTAAQCLRFIDSELYYQERELNTIIQALRINTCEERRIWFREIRSCRRRNQVVNFDSTPVARIFTEPDQYKYLAFRATIARVRGLMQQKRMFLLDAFRAFDTDRDGHIGCSELFAGFEWLGMRLTPLQIQDFMRDLSPETGYLTYEQFKLAFMDKSLRDADPLLGGGNMLANANKSADPFAMEAEQDEDDEDEKVIFSEVVIVPKKIEELNEIGKEDSTAKSEKQKLEEETRIVKVLNNVSFKLVPHGYYSSIWNTRAFKGAANKCGLWKAELDLGWYSRRKKELIAFGSYGINGYQTLSESNGFKVLEMYGAKSHSSIRDRLLPTPKRYSLVFSKTQGTQLYIWQPIPPSDKFVALGHVATITAKEPPLDSVRCVPLDWCEKWKGTPVLVWTDVGTAGRSGSIWQYGSCGSIVATIGHDSPKGPFYDLKTTSWLVSSDWAMIPQGAGSGEAAIKEAFAFSKRPSAEE
jgi:Ca2+-binding EF-hand superfamily protein